jgi:hypothetical protein
MEVLVLDGKNYVKASKAARDLGYASDYVGQLCRSGQVDAHLIGRTWYVNQTELGTHRFEKKRMSRVKAREQAKKAIQEHRLKVTETPNNYKNIDIRYESDDEELIPETKRLEVQSVIVRRGRQKVEEPEYDSETTIENKGEKVVMSGDLKVVDVTEGPIETDTVLLKPGRIRSGTITVAPRVTDLIKNQGPAEESKEDSLAEADEVEEEPRASFAERLKATEVASEAPETHAEPDSDAETATTEGSVLPYVLLTVILCVLVLMTLPVSKITEYSDQTGETLISYKFSLSDVISIIQSKI